VNAARAFPGRPAECPACAALDKTLDSDAADGWCMGALLMARMVIAKEGPLPFCRKHAEFLAVGLRALGLPIDRFIVLNAASDPRNS